ncbi:MAG TPA: glycosyltransferase family 39 protein [Thermoanaerobaculia bacterium]|nr:glycosyltransferase family 39 protein [Thermoanaerobaculia bacterium]
MIAMLALLAGQILALLIVTSTGWALGRLLFRRLQFSSVADEVSLCTTLGLGVAGTFLFLLGLAHALYALVILAVVIAVHLLAVPLWLETFARVRRWWEERDPVPRLELLPFVALTPAFVLSLYPPNAWDETMYHLPFAKLFLREHAVVFAETLRFPLFPQLGEMLFAAILALSGDVQTHTVQLLAALLIAMAIQAHMRRRNVVSSVMGAALWLGSPIVVYYAATSYVDHLLTLFCTVSCTMWLRWREEGSSRWLLLSAACAGFAAGTKYLGLYFACALAILTMFGGRPRGVVRAVSLFAVVSLLTLSPWYVRNTAATGNPVFPFLSEIFGKSEWTSAIDRAVAEGENPKEKIMHAGRHLLPKPAELITLPWRVVSDREHLAGEPPYSPFLFIALPLIAMAVIRDRDLRLMAGAVLLYVLVVSKHDVRFLLPVVPLFCLAGGVGIDWLLGALRRYALSAAVVLMLIAPALVYGALKIVQRGAVPATAAARHEFLERVIRPYRALQYLNEARGRDYVLYGAASPNAIYYAEGVWLGEVMGPARYSFVRSKTSSSAELFETLRSLGADHLLIDRTFPGVSPPDAEALSSDFRLLLRYDAIELYALRP